MTIPLPDTPSQYTLQRARQFRYDYPHRENTTREQRMIIFLSDGEPHHAFELIEAVSYDFRKVISNIIRMEGYRIHKFPVGKHKYYQLEKYDPTPTSQGIPDSSPHS